MADASKFLSQSAQDFIEDPANLRHRDHRLRFLSQSAQDFIEDNNVSTANQQLANNS